MCDWTRSMKLWSWKPVFSMSNIATQGVAGLLPFYLSTRDRPLSKPYGPWPTGVGGPRNTKNHWISPSSWVLVAKIWQLQSKLFPLELLSTKDHSDPNKSDKSYNYKAGKPTKRILSGTCVKFELCCETLRVFLGHCHDNWAYFWRTVNQSIFVYVAWQQTSIKNIP